MLIMLPQRDLSEKIMHRVRAIFVFRSLMLPILVELGAVGALVLVVVMSVSLTDVMLNFQNSVSEGFVLTYVYWAIVNTELTLQIFMLLGFGVSVYFVYRFAKTVRISSHTEAVRV